MAIDKVLKLVFKAEDQTAKGITNAKSNVDKFSKSAKKGEAGIGGAVEQADKLESTLAKVVKIGVVIELGIGGIKAGMVGLSALSAGLAGDLDAAGKAAEELKKSVSEIPVVGKLVGVGEELNNLFTGAKDEANRLNTAVEGMNKNLDLTAKYINAARAAGQKLSGIQLGIDNARELAAAAESERAILAAKQEYEAAVKQAQDNQNKNLSEASRQYTRPEMAEINKIDKQIASQRKFLKQIQDEGNQSKIRNDTPLYEQRISDLVAKKYKLQVDIGTGDITATNKTIELQAKAEIAAAELVRDEKIRLAEEANKKQFDLTAKAIQDQINLTQKRQKDSQINNEFDKRVATIETDTAERVNAVETKYTQLLAKYDQNSKEAEQLRNLKSQELAVIEKDNLRATQNVEADRYTAGIISEVEDAEEANSRQKKAIDARATAVAALASIEKSALEARAANGDEAAKKQLQENQVAERYLRIQNQITEAMKDQNTTEAEKLRLKELSEKLSEEQKKEISSIGKTAASVNTGGLTARLFSQDRTIGVTTSPELSEAKEANKLATKTNNTLDNIYSEMRNNRIVVG